MGNVLAKAQLWQGTGVNRSVRGSGWFFTVVTLKDSDLCWQSPAPGQALHLACCALAIAAVINIFMMLLVKQMNKRQKKEGFYIFHSPFLKTLFMQLLQGGSEQLLRSLHLQKDASAYSYICPGAQLKVRGLRDPGTA